MASCCPVKLVSNCITLKQHCAQWFRFVFLFLYRLHIDYEGYFIFIKSTYYLLEMDPQQNSADQSGQTKPSKKDHKKEENKKPKHPRPLEYERNADLITIDTVLEPLPKKNEILAKPSHDDYSDKVKKLRDRIGKLIDDKKEIRNEKYKRPKVEIKGEGGVHDQFNQEVGDFKQLKEKYHEVKERRNRLRDDFKEHIEEAKRNNIMIQELRQAVKNSRENIEERIDFLQKRLRTADLGKQEEKNLHQQITNTKRKLKDADSGVAIEARLENAEQRKEQLDNEIENLKHQKEPLQKECKELQAEMDEKNDVISKLKGQIKNVGEEKSQAREKSQKLYDQWKDSKKKRLDKAQQQIKKIQTDIKSIWNQFHSKSDQYWNQKHKLDFLQWQHKIQKRKVEQVEREKRKALYEQKEKQREKEESMKKYINQIQTCNTLISYLQELQRTSTKNEEKEEKKDVVDINDALNNASQWKKEKGLEVIQSKKSKQEESNVKKGKKYKKKHQQKNEDKKKFEIPLQIEHLFDSLKVLVPEAEEEINKKIEELKDREALFMRACSEDVNEADQDTINKIVGKNKKEKRQKEKNPEQDEFPAL